MEYGKFDERLGRSSEKIWLLTIEEKERRLKEIFKKKMGYELDLENPKAFTEKIQWYKLYYDHPDLTRCIDKVGFKEYIAEKIGSGYTAKLLKVWNSPDEVDLNSLPDGSVVKSNCQDDGSYIQILRKKADLDIKEIENEIKTYWFNPLNLLINGFCGGYKKIIPKVLVEEYLNMLDGSLVKEYKVHCFNGKPEYVYNLVNRVVDDKLNFTKAFPASFYTLDWNRVDVVNGTYKPYYDAPKPYHYKDILEISEVLSKDFPHVRVDFMDTPDKLYIGELTFYSFGGFFKLDPKEFDYKLGELFIMDN